MANNLRDWANGGTSRAPTANELSNGFTCGAADPDLFNYLVQELGKCCPPNGVDNGDILEWDAASTSWQIGDQRKQRYAVLAGESQNNYRIENNFGSSSYTQMPFHAEGDPFTTVAPALGTVVIVDMPLQIDANGDILILEDSVFLCNFQHRVTIHNSVAVNGDWFAQKARATLNGGRILHSDIINNTDTPITAAGHPTHLFGESTAFIVNASAGDILSIEERCHHESGGATTLDRTNKSYLTISQLPFTK